MVTPYEGHGTTAPVLLCHVVLPLWTLSQAPSKRPQGSVWRSRGSRQAEGLGGALGWGRLQRSRLASEAPFPGSVSAVDQCWVPLREHSPEEERGVQDIICLTGPALLRTLP